MAIYFKICVKEETYKKFLESKNLIRKRNTIPADISLTDDFSINWLIDVYREKII